MPGPTSSTAGCVLSEAGDALYQHSAGVIRANRNNQHRERTVTTSLPNPKSKYQASKFGAAPKRSDRMPPLHREVIGGGRSRGRLYVFGGVRSRDFLVQPFAASHHEDRTSRKRKRIPPRPITYAYLAHFRSRDDPWEAAQSRAGAAAV